MLNKLDLGELYQFEQARESSIDLLIKWLTQYTFKTSSRIGKQLKQEQKKLPK